jgi:tRNA threonylcarbamoyladenosine biosynthesis protein TsaE
VQPYDALAGYEVWHIDLYRLTTAQDALALGIEEAFFDAACLIEWPDKIADLLPATAVTISLSITGELSRHAEIFASEQEQAIMSDMLGPEPS